MRKMITVSVLLTIAAIAAQGDSNYSGVGAWHTAANWTGVLHTSGIPGSSDNVTLSGSPSVTMDANSWQYFEDNELLTSGATGEMRNRQIRVGSGSGTQIMNLNYGDGNTYRVTYASTYFIGSANGSDATLNILSGQTVMESSKFYIGEKGGSTGLVNISGNNANTRLIISRETGGTSLWVGDGGNGTLKIDEGKLRTRGGAIIGATGTFSVLGGGVTEVEIGTEGTVDGSWHQKAGGLLNIGVDSSGLTTINVADKGSSNTGTYGDGNVTFDSGALLDVSFLDGSQVGSWDVMHWDGALLSGGLAFAPGVDTSVWSMEFVDTDAVGGADTLRVTAVPEPATIGLLGMFGIGIFAARRFRR